MIPSLVLIVLLVVGYVGSTALMSVTGTATGPRRVAGLVVFAFVAALLLDLISGAFAWGWPIHQFWPLWPIMALVILTAALVASVLEKLFGAAGTFLTIMVMILFGNPSTGGAVGAPFLPSFWLHLGPFLPARNGLTAVHSTMYFNGHGMTQAIVILGVYAVVFGAASQFLGSYRTPRLPLDVAPETQMQSTGMSIAGTAIAWDAGSRPLTLRRVATAGSPTGRPIRDYVDSYPSEPNALLFLAVPLVVQGSNRPRATFFWPAESLLPDAVRGVVARRTLGL